MASACNSLFAKSLRSNPSPSLFFSSSSHSQRKKTSPSSSSSAKKCPTSSSFTLPPPSHSNSSSAGSSPPDALQHEYAIHSSSPFISSPHREEKTGDRRKILRETKESSGGRKEEKEEEEERSRRKERDEIKSPMKDEDLRKKSNGTGLSSRRSPSRTKRVNYLSSSPLPSFSPSSVFSSLLSSEMSLHSQLSSSSPRPSSRQPRQAKEEEKESLQTAVREKREKKDYEPSEKRKKEAAPWNERGESKEEEEAKCEKKEKENRRYEEYRDGREGSLGVEIKTMRKRDMKEMREQEIIPQENEKREDIHHSYEEDTILKGAYPRIETVHKPSLQCLQEGEEIHRKTYLSSSSSTSLPQGKDSPSVFQISSTLRCSPSSASPSSSSSSSPSSSPSSSSPSSSSPSPCSSSRVHRVSHTVERGRRRREEEENEERRREKEKEEKEEEKSLTRHPSYATLRKEMVSPSYHFVSSSSFSLSPLHSDRIACTSPSRSLRILRDENAPRDSQQSPRIQTASPSSSSSFSRLLYLHEQGEVKEETREEEEEKKVSSVRGLSSLHRSHQEADSSRRQNTPQPGGVCTPQLDKKEEEEKKPLSSCANQKKELHVKSSLSPLSSSSSRRHGEEAQSDRHPRKGCEACSGEKGEKEKQRNLIGSKKPSSSSSIAKGTGDGEGRGRTPLKVVEDLYEKHREGIARREALKFILEEQEMKGCSFQPRINRRTRPLSSSSSWNEKRSLSACVGRSSAQCPSATARNGEKKQMSFPCSSSSCSSTWREDLPRERSVYDRLHESAKRKKEKCYQARHLLHLLETQSFSFHPEINASSSSSCRQPASHVSSSSPHVPLYLRIDEEVAKKELTLEKLRQQSLEEEISSCTFAPAILPRSRKTPPRFSSSSSSSSSFSASSSTVSKKNLSSLQDSQKTKRMTTSVEMSEGMQLGKRDGEDEKKKKKEGEERTVVTLRDLLLSDDIFKNTTVTQDLSVDRREEDEEEEEKEEEGNKETSLLRCKEQGEEKEKGEEEFVGEEGDDEFMRDVVQYLRKHLKEEKEGEITDEEEEEGESYEGVCHENENLNLDEEEQKSEKPSCYRYEAEGSPQSPFDSIHSRERRRRKEKEKEEEEKMRKKISSQNRKADTRSRIRGVCTAQHETCPKYSHSSSSPFASSSSSSSSSLPPFSERLVYYEYAKRKRMELLQRKHTRGVVTFHPKICSTTEKLLLIHPHRPFETPDERLHRLAVEDVERRKKKMEERRKKEEFSFHPEIDEVSRAIAEKQRRSLQDLIHKGREKAQELRELLHRHTSSHEPDKTHAKDKDDEEEKKRKKKKEEEEDKSFSHLDPPDSTEKRITEMSASPQRGEEEERKRHKEKEEENFRRRGSGGVGLSRTILSRLTTRASSSSLNHEGFSRDQKTRRNERNPSRNSLRDGRSLHPPPPSPSPPPLPLSKQKKRCNRYSHLKSRFSDMNTYMQKVEEERKKKEILRQKYKKKLEEKELAECTFQPQLPHSASIFDEEQSIIEPSFLEVKGFDRFIELRLLAQKKEEEKRQREIEVFYKSSDSLPSSVSSSCGDFSSSPLGFRQNLVGIKVPDWGALEPPRNLPPRPPLNSHLLNSSCTSLRTKPSSLSSHSHPPSSSLLCRKAQDEQMRKKKKTASSLLLASSSLSPSSRLLFFSSEEANEKLQREGRNDKAKDRSRRSLSNIRRHGEFGDSFKKRESLQERRRQGGEEDSELLEMFDKASYHAGDSEEEEEGEEGVFSSYSPRSSRLLFSSSYLQ
ncbi:hypothetical protein CSUI_004874 [Cystoisospora suis]|uniref:Uncharacterized protein n=1 Tax=Cystoisospora suis TaxID=483139 RepID=A0A2C6KVS4_9APIC|nr:hypothetical protein CSUI_004874 [Cystoisospora suis]